MNPRECLTKDSKSQFVVRLASLEDVKKLDSQGWFGGFSDGRKAYEYSLQEPGRGHGQLILAFVNQNDKEFFIGQVWVDHHSRPSMSQGNIAIIADLSSDRQNFGVGTALIQYAEDFARSLQYEQSVIGYELNNPLLDKLRYLYEEKFGYSPISSEPVTETAWVQPFDHPVIFARYTNAIVLRKSLTPPLS